MFLTPMQNERMLSNSLPLKFGFRSGNKGTHTSRTIMLDELSTLLDSAPSDAGRDDFLAAIIDHNALGKQTAATRKLTAQRLTELYILEPSAPPVPGFAPVLAG